MNDNCEVGKIEMIRNIVTMSVITFGIIVISTFVIAPNISSWSPDAQVLVALVIAIIIVGISVKVIN